MAVESRTIRKAIQRGPDQHRLDAYEIGTVITIPRADVLRLSPPKLSLPCLDPGQLTQT